MKNNLRNTQTHAVSQELLMGKRNSLSCARLENGNVWGKKNGLASTCARNEKSAFRILYPES